MQSFDLDHVFFGITLGNWVVLIHDNMTQNYNMDKFLIEPNDYGYDAYASIIVAILSKIQLSDIMNAIKSQPPYANMIEDAHAAWTNNYVKWKYHFMQPNYKTIIGEFNLPDRNDNATTQACYLNDHIQTMYKDIIDVIFNILTDAIMQSGFSNMQIHHG